MPGSSACRIASNGDAVKDLAPVAGSQFSFSEISDDQNHRQPETGNGNAERGDHADHLVDPAIGLDRRDHPHGDARDQRQHQSDRHDQERIGKGAGDRGGDLFAREQRLRQVALHDVGEPRAVLHQERPVETVDLPDLGDARVGGVVAGERHRDIAGDQLQQREHHEGRKQDDGQRLQQAAADHPCRTSSRHRLQLSSQTSSYFGLPSRFGL